MLLKALSKISLIGSFGAVFFFLSSCFVYGATSVTWTITDDFDTNAVIGPDLISGTADDGETSGTTTTLADVITRNNKVVLDGEEFTTIAGGYAHTLAIKSDGTLWGTGYNFYGQLGLNDTADRDTLTQIGTDTDWTSVTAGYYHTLAIKSDGTLWGTGFNGDGELGLNDTADRDTLTQIGVDTDWTSVTAGDYHTIALKSDGTLWGSGYNGESELGLGDTTNRDEFTQIGTSTLWQSVFTGSYHVLALKSDGTLWGWGMNYDGCSYGCGQLGLGTGVATAVTPTQIGTDTDWTSVTAGDYHTIALKSDGTLWGTGYNSYGQLGLNDTTDRDTLTQIGTDTDWTLVTAGSHHTLAFKSDGTLWGTGFNSDGELGLGDTTNRDTLTQIGVDIDWTSVTAGTNHTLALKSDGTLWGWGMNYDGCSNEGCGQLGLGTGVATAVTPTQIGSSIWAPFIIYPASGTLFGLKLHAGAGETADWTTLSWNSLALLENTSIKFRVRTSDDNSTYSAWSDYFIQNTLSSTSGTGDLSSAIPSQYIEIEVTLISDTEFTPTLLDFTLVFAPQVALTPVIEEDDTEISDGSEKPTKLKTKETESGVRLTWKDNTDLEDRYRVERKLHGGPVIQGKKGKKMGSGTFTKIASLKKNTEKYVDKDPLIKGATYVYRVRAENDSEKGDYSNTARVKLKNASWVPVVIVGPGSVPKSAPDILPLAPEPTPVSASETPVISGTGIETVTAVEVIDDADGVIETVIETVASIIDAVIDMIVAVIGSVLGDSLEELSSVTEPGTPSVSDGTMNTETNTEEIDDGEQSFKEEVLSVAITIKSSTQDWQGHAKQVGVPQAIAETAKTMVTSDAGKAIIVIAPAIQLSAMLSQVGLSSLLNLIASLGNFGAIVSRRGRRKQYGIVFDSLTGKPLIGARIIIHTETTSTQPILTNGFGMYIALVPPGTYTVSVEKEGYEMTGEGEILRLDRTLYTGGILTFSEPGAINADIPMKQKETVAPSLFTIALKRHEKSFARFSSFVFYVGVLFALGLMFWQPTFMHGAILLVYLLLILLRKLGLGQAVWGEILFQRSKRPAHFASVKLLSPQGNLERRTIADEYGRYYLFAGAGLHTLKVECEDLTLQQMRSREKSIRMREELGVVMETVEV